VRIGLVSPYSFDVPGGVQAHVRDLADELLRQGHSVSVLAPADDDDPDLPGYVVPAGRAVPVPYNGSVARLSFGFLSATRVRRWIRDGEFDVLHVHEPASPSLGLLACWAAIGPIVATFHAAMDRSRAMNAANGMLQTALEKVSARIAVSEAARETLVEHLGGDAVLIPNGVALRSFRGTSTIDGWPGEGGALGFLGRIDESRKGLEVLLAALPAIVAARPGVRLLVAGPGDVNEVRGWIPRDLRDRVHFLGLVSDETKAAMLRSVDVFVAPNTGGESFGIVLLEAMAAGTPVLASDLESFRPVLDDGNAGELFRPEDPADLAAHALRLLGDRARRSEVASAADKVVDRYDWERVAHRVVAVYEAVTWNGLKVREDNRGQLFGRFTRLRDDSS
jgi:phosphatidyl-myo-inositol alpha-mannosyltransferase